MDLLSASLAGLILLFALSLLTTHVLGIRRDRFYRPFHFAGGFLSALLAIGLINAIVPGQFSSGAIIVLVLLFTLIVGLLWETYEWVQWRLFLKDTWRRPTLRDTTDDLGMDILGAIAALLVAALLR